MKEQCNSPEYLASLSSSEGVGAGPFCDAELAGLTCASPSMGVTGLFVAAAAAALGGGGPGGGVGVGRSERADWEEPV